MPKLKQKLQPLLITLVVAILSGCSMPPDVVDAPKLGPAPQIHLDGSVNGKSAIRSKILETAAQHPEQHSVVLLEAGDDALLARIHLIRAARKSIDIQTYIWVYDRSGSWVYQELLAAAQRGVTVRVLIDQFVNPGISVDEYAAIVTAHKNLEVRLFRPLTENAINTTWDLAPNTFTRFTTMNQRMHNKVMLVDGTSAIVGGRNYQDAYFDRDPVLNFLDRDVIVSGPSSRRIQSSFLEFWNHHDACKAIRMSDLSKSLKADRARMPSALQLPLDPIFSEIDALADDPDLALVRPALKSWQVEHIRYITDTPEKITQYNTPAEYNPFKEIKDLIANAGSDILIQTPYPIVEDRSYKEYKKMREKSPNLRVRLSTNSLSSADHLSVGSIALKQRRMQIEGLRVELHLAKPVPEDIRHFVPRYEQILLESASSVDPNWNDDSQIVGLDIEGPRFCVHSKSMVVDSELSIVGSHNFDPRSANLNTECGVFIKDKAFANHLTDRIERMIHPRNSWVVAPRRFPPVVDEFNSLLSLISSNLPLFDIWPLEDVSCFELKEGSDPLSPYDPEFYEHYDDVGALPGMDLGLDSVRIRLIRAFAGATAPLM